MCGQTRMPLAPGTRLANYEIVSPIGAGGMGEVYRARDTSLKRDVALKILPESFATDAERLARFQREAEVLASLNHPNIAGIHGLAETDGIKALVMELVDGEDLAERIERGPIPLDEVLPIARQIAEALEAAHEQGIIHRDLKPANVKVRKDGTVKVLDFGLAKAMAPAAAPGDLANSPTITSPAMTQAGMILGTVAYMSPEQARGQSVDKRTDIWAFACVVYEMLTGRAAFRGDTTSDTIAKVLEREPEWGSLPPDLPAAIRTVLRRCLQKETRRRLHDIADARIELEEGSASPTPAAVRTTTSGNRYLWWAVALAMTLATLWAVTDLTRTQMGPATYQRLTFRQGHIFSARFAPDGQTVIYSATWLGNPDEVFSTRPGNPESRALGYAGADILAISPTGEMALGLRASHGGGFIRGTLARVALTGSAPRLILDDVRAADWSPDGKDLVVAHVVNGKHRIEFPIGKVLYQTSNQIVDVRVSPDGQYVAFVEGSSVALVDRNGLKRVLSASSGTGLSAVWRPRGDELWFSSSELGNAFAASGLFAVTLAGRQRPLVRLPVGATLVDLSRDGRALVKIGKQSKGIRSRRAGDSDERDLSWLDWGLVADLSQDGMTLLFSEGGTGGGIGRSTYLRKTDGTPPVRLGEGTAVALSPDGLWALALRGTSGPVRLLALPTGAGEPKFLTDERMSCSSASFFPDGKRVLMVGAVAGEKPRLYALRLADGALTPITNPGVEGTKISPDGRWLLGSSGGLYALYPMDGGPPRTIPGLTRDDEPIDWSDDGGSIYVRRDFQPDNPDVVTVFRLNVATGGRQLWHEFAVSELVRTAILLPLVIARDGRSYRYTYHRGGTDLYLVEGLR